MSFARKYRPKSFKTFIGNQKTVEAVQGILDGRTHSFMITGPTGCGKTTMGRIIANELQCVGQDFCEMDSADFRGIDTIRNLRKQIQYRPIEKDSKCRVFLMDEVHKLTGDAQSALLKNLEEPPDHIYFILCTTDPQKVIPTIRGRCVQLSVSPLSDEQMKRLLKRVSKRERIELPEEVMEQIIEDSAGFPRNALKILDKISALAPEEMLETAKQEAAVQNQAIELCQALIKKAGWKQVSNILQGLKDEEPESIRRLVLGYCSSVLLKSGNSDAFFILESFEDPLYDIGRPGLVLACYRAVQSIA